MFANDGLDAGSRRTGIRPDVLLHQCLVRGNDLQAPVYQTIRTLDVLAQFPVAVTSAEEMRLQELAVTGNQIKVEVLGQLSRIDYSIDTGLVWIVVCQILLLHKRRDRHTVGQSTPQCRQQSLAWRHRHPGVTSGFA